MSASVLSSREKFQHRQFCSARYRHLRPHDHHSSLYWRTKQYMARFVATDLPASSGAMFAQGMRNFVTHDDGDFVIRQFQSIENTGKTRSSHPAYSGH